MLATRACASFAGALSAPVAMSTRRPFARWSRFAAIERAFAGVLALLVVLGGFVDLHHQATTRHVVCAAHGTMVHGSSTALDLAGTGDELGPKTSTPQAELHQRPGTSSLREHEHCTFPRAASSSTVAPPRLAVRATELVPPAVRDIVDRAVGQGRGVYRSAPKTSPPV